MRNDGPRAADTPYGARFRAPARHQGRTGGPEDTLTARLGGRAEGTVPAQSRRTAAAGHPDGPGRATARPEGSPAAAVAGVPRGSLWAFGLETGVLAGTAVGCWLTVRALEAVALPVGRSAAVLAVVCGIGAAIMIAVAGRASGSRRAVRLAGAVAGYTVVGPLATALALPGTGLWPLVGVVGLLGVVALVVLGVRRRSPAHRPVTIVATAVLAVAATAAGMVRGIAPAIAVPAGAVGTAYLAAWAGAGAAGLLAIGAGLRRDRPLLRRIGAAFVLVAAAHAVPGTALPLGLELAATVAFLAAAVPFLLHTVLRRP